MKVAAVNPNFFIVGAPKAGTTAMAQYLSEHPQVFFSTPKELFYWNEDDPSLRRRQEVHTVDQYLNYFAEANPAQHQAVGEGSTTYLQSRTAVPLIMDFNPQARIIAMLRNPIETVHAMHGHLCLRFLEDEPDIEKAWALQEERAQGRSLPKKVLPTMQLQYRDVASFADQIERVYSVVPPEQRLILLYDDFRSDAASAYARVLEFLQLDHDGRVEFPKVNVARRPRLPWLERLHRVPPRPLAGVVKLGKTFVRMLGKGARERVKGYLEKPQQRTALRPEFQNYLSDVFREDIQRTGQLLGRDLSHWSRTDVPE